MAKPLPVPQKLLDFIKKGDKFIIAGHKDPDGDSTGSQLALTSVLQRMGKTAIPCSAGPFNRTELIPYKEFFTTSFVKEELNASSVIALDCSSLERTGDIAQYLENLPFAVIDHHAVAPHDGENACYLDPAAPSTTCMVLEVISALGLEPTLEEAEFILFGLCTDTGFFKYTSEDGAETFEYAARLTRIGASPKKIFSRINSGKSLDSRYLLGIQLSRVRSYFGGKLLITAEKQEETETLGVKGRDMDALYLLLQTVEGAKVVSIIRQETPERCTIGFRSKDEVNVGIVASQFGGGGHKNAAGASVSGVIRDVYPQVVDAFKTVFESPDEDLSYINFF